MMDRDVQITWFRQWNRSRFHMDITKKELFALIGKDSAILLFGDE